MTVLEQVTQEIIDFEEMVSSFFVQIKEMNDKYPNRSIPLALDLENLRKSLQIENKTLELELFFEKLNLLFSRFNIIKNSYIQNFVEPAREAAKEQQQQQAEIVDSMPETISAGTGMVEEINLKKK